MVTLGISAPFAFSLPKAFKKTKIVKKNINETLKKPSVVDVMKNLLAYKPM
jgi:hypothetical protein